MTLVSVIASAFQHFPAWLSAATSIVSAASAVTALTPTPKDDKILTGVRQVLEVLALNIGHAKRTGSGN